MVHGGAALTGGDDNADHRAFLRVLCHELGTPVASVQALARALARHRTALTSEQRAEALRLISDHAQHMAAMLDAVRVVADHLPRPAPPIGPTQLEEVVRGATDAAGINDLRVSIAPVVRTVIVDVSAVRRILTNLLANARQHGADPIHLDADGRVDVLRLEITDHGAGMPAHVAATAFRQQTPVGDGPHGLGLWIVSQLVAMLGGSVHARAALPVGTRIRVVLPLKR